MQRIRLLLLLCLICSCASSTQGNQAKMSQLQLQEQMQRFYTRFTERLVESLSANLSIAQNIKLSEISYKQYLLYDQEALKIVTGPYPEINMLDMLVFIKLSKTAVKDYWIPNFYHQHGAGLLNAFNDSEKDMEKVAEQLISKEEISQIDQLIAEWKKDHPRERRVEKIRFDEFSKFIATSKVSGKLQSGFSFSKMIVDTQSAVSAVDEMVLVANRGMFLVQQMPFLIRLHTRIMAMEMVDDISLRFGFQPPGYRTMMQAQEDTSPGMIKKLEFILDGAYQSINYLKSSPKISTKILWQIGVVFILLVLMASAIFWGMYWLVRSRLAKS